MAATLTDNKLVIRYKIGVNESGRDVFRQQTLNNITPEAHRWKSFRCNPDLIAAVLDYSVCISERSKLFF